MASCLFNLNELPDEYSDLECAGEMEFDIPNIEPSEEVVIRSSSNETLVIDMNVNANQEFQYPILDLNVDYLQDHLQEEEESHFAFDSDTWASNDGISLDDNRQRKRFSSNDQRLAIYTALLERSVNGKLKRNTTNEVASIFSVHIRTVQRIWKRAKDTPNGTIVDVSHRKTKNCGRKRVQLDLNRIADVPLSKRTTLRSLAAALNVGHTALYNLLKQGLIRCHSNAIKPHLKEENKRARLQFCLSMLEKNSLPHEPRFIGMYNVVHIDEKWFYMTKKTEKYYLLPMEEEPLRSCQSKNYIGKVMFLAAMARPRFDNQGNEVFSGKIGVFPFVTKKPALRRSRNREAGTLVTTPITSVNRETIRTYLLEKVIPKIQAVWPSGDSRSTIYIQQDNARTHVDPNDEEFQRAASQNGFDIRLKCQPANSPDLNILDLGYFNAIQSLQQKVNAKTVDELVHAVEKSFDEYPTRKVEHIFLTLQLCMIEIMKIEGSNRYKIPHMNKARLEREGCLPTQINCDPTLVQNIMSQFR